jgi:hypothetical protein
MMYRLLTEDINRRKVLAAVSKHFDGFTITPAIGYWKGHKENSIAIDIETQRAREVKKLALEIKAINKQDAVLIQRFAPKSSLV